MSQVLLSGESLALVDLATPATVIRPTRDSSQRPLKFASRALALGMLLVVFDHSLVPTVTSDASTPVIHRWMESAVPFFKTINMPLVFFISGLLFAFTWPKTSLFPTVGLLKDKALRLLFPYWVLSSVAFPVKAMLGEYARRPVDFSWAGYAVNLLYPWANTIIYFWFLPTLFVIFLFAPLLRWISCHRGLATKLVVTLLLIELFVAFEPGSPTLVLPFNWTGVLHYLLFFWCGIWLCRSVIDASQSGHARRAAAFGLVALGSSVCIYNLVPEVGPRWMLAMNVLGIIGVVSFSIGTQAIVSRPFDLLARNSYQIFLFSWFFHQAVILLSKKVPAISAGYFDLLSLCLGLLGPLAVAFVVRKIPNGWVQLAAGIKSRSPQVVVESHSRTLHDRVSSDEKAFTEFKTAWQ